MKIQLKRFDDDGSIVTLGEIADVNGALVGDTELAKKILREPMFDPVTHKHLRVQDGDKFLMALHRSLSGAYLWATKPE